MGCLVRWQTGCNSDFFLLEVSKQGLAKHMADVLDAIETLFRSTGFVFYLLATRGVGF